MSLGLFCLKFEEILCAQEGSRIIDVAVARPFTQNTVD